jgi:hypothetical protein
MCTASQNSEVDDLGMLYGLLWIVPMGNLVSLTLLRQVHHGIACRFETILFSLVRHSQFFCFFFLV